MSELNSQWINFSKKKIEYDSMQYCFYSVKVVNVKNTLLPSFDYYKNGSILI